MGQLPATLSSPPRPGMRNSHVEQIIADGSLEQVRALEVQLSALVAMSITGDGPRVTKLAPVYLRLAQRKIVAMEAGHDTTPEE